MQVNSLRVLIISHTYTAPFNRAKLDALARQVTLSALAPKRWQETLFHLDATIAHTNEYDLRALPIHFSGHILRYFYPFRTLLQVVRACNPQIIYVEEEPASLALAQLVLLKRRAKLICFTWENIERRVGTPGIEQFNLARCDGVIAGNRDAAEIMRRKKFRSPIAITPQLGVDPNVFTPGESHAHPAFTIGYIGRLIEAKGIYTLLAAIANQPHTSLVLVGAGPLRDEIAHWITERELGQRIQITSAVPHQAIPRLIQSLDALVLPSHTTPTWKEQFGHVLIEAMACGVPVIGSDSGAIPEVIGNAGVIVPERDVKALHDALAQLVAAPSLRSEFARAGRARVLAHFTHERIAQANVDFFQQVLAK